MHSVNFLVALRLECASEKSPFRGLCSPTPWSQQESGHPAQYLGKGWIGIEP